MPDGDLVKLIGISTIAFNSNLQFLIKNYLTKSENSDDDWWTLTDIEAGQIRRRTKDFLIENGFDEIDAVFNDLVNKRNRIIHSFSVTCQDGTQGLNTLDRKTHNQFQIDEQYLHEFIVDNQGFSDLLYKMRDGMRDKGNGGTVNDTKLE
jgi:hypothetical protein